MNQTNVANLPQMTLQREVVSEALSRVVLLGVLTAAASAIQIAESPLPRLLPWLKPGLSNALLLFAVIRHSPGFALSLVAGRTIVTGMLLGTLFTPAGLLSLLGGGSAAAAMLLCRRLGRGRGGLAGISVAGAVAHNAAQLGGVAFFAGEGLPVFLHLSLMLGAAIPSGLLVAGLAHQLLRRTS
ncbi:MAG TPA: Gx transporter family protein [Candidatus Ozemobacteraceae bacterium]|nr:Gx transporter family protein [Candidatus Ozemobacteraceae bacterium]